MTEENERTNLPASNGRPAAQEGKKSNYVVIFVALTALTLLEVFVTYTPLPRLLVLMPLALLKAGLVVLFYMHLRYDSRIFSAIFLMGLLMGIILIISLMVLFGPPLFGVRQ